MFNFIHLEFSNDVFNNWIWGLEEFNYNNVNSNCPLRYKYFFTLMHASVISFGSGLALNKYDDGYHHVAYALFENKTGSLPDNIYPVGGKYASKTNKYPYDSTITSDCLNAFRAAGLTQHNLLRAKHGANLMTRDSTLEADAQEAVELITDYGSNLYYFLEDIGENYYSSTDSTNLNAAKCARMAFLFYLKLPKNF